MNELSNEKKPWVRFVEIVNGYSTLILLIAIFLYVLIFSLIGVWKYHNYLYNSLDLAIFNQTFYNTSTGNLFGLTIHPPTYLNDHFPPLLLILTLLYLPFKHLLILIIFQNITLALAAWPLYLIAKNILKKPWPLLIALAFLINPFVQNLSLFEFHLLPFALLFLFFGFWFYQRNKFIPFMMMASLALLVREDVALVIFMFGVLAWLDKKALSWIITPISLSIIYFILAFLVINNFSAASGYKFLIYYAWLGSNWLEIIRNVILKPWLVISKWFSLANLEMILGFLLPLAFLPVIKPKYLLISLLIFLQITLGAPGGSHLILNTQYSTLFLPALFIAFIYALKKISETDFKSKFFQKLKKEKTLAVLTLITAIIYGSLTLGPLPGTLIKIYKNETEAEAKIKDSLIAQVPPKAPVAASYDFITKLSSRSQVYAFNYFFIGKQQFGQTAYNLPDDTKYLVINFDDFITYEVQYKNNDLYKDNYLKGAKRVRERIQEDNFGVLEIVDSWAILKKDNPTNILLYQTFDQLPEIAFSQPINLENKIEFLGYDQSSYFKNLLPISFYWQALEKLTDNYHLKVILKGEKDKIIKQKLYPLAYGLYPTIDWQPGQIIKTNYWFWLEPDLKNTSGAHTLEVELIKIIEGGLYLNPDRSARTVLNKTERLGNLIKIEPFNF